MIFDSVAGASCPFAIDCLSKADRVTGKIKDGKDTKFRCYAASAEALYPTVRLLRWHNFDLLKQTKGTKQLTDLISDSITNSKYFSKKITHVRIHTSGDFFKKDYFQAWLNVAKLFPNLTFYCYTKAIHFWVEEKNNVPNNFILTASKGGKFDLLIDSHNLKKCEVVYSVEEAISKDLPIDHEDTYPLVPNQSFAILIHGTQPAKTEASKAMMKLRKEGLNGYGKASKRIKKLKAA